MSGIFESMGIDSGIVIIILLILTIILLINVVSSNMRLRRLERKYKMFMRGGDAQSLEKVFVRKFAQIDRLYEGGITMNGQIVLCKGVNDGEELERSIRDMMKYLPCLQSVSVVPVGLTKYREGLYPLESFTKEDAKEVLSIIHKWQKKAYDEYGYHFIHAGDEWYILAEEEMPEEERYDGYLQLENGVGMMRLLQNEFAEEYAGLEGDDTEREVLIATGVLAYPLICKMASAIEKKYTKTKIHVYGIRNDFFGEKITVSGLITGRDLISQLTDQPLGTCLLLPCNMVRIQEQDFLDDLTRDQVEEALQVKTDIVKSSGRDFIEAVLKHEKEITKDS